MIINNLLLRSHVPTDKVKYIMGLVLMSVVRTEIDKGSDTCNSF